jgi:hypothetical protein
MMSGKELDIGIKLEGNFKKSRRGSCFCCLLYLKFFGYINGIQSAKFGLLIDTIINIHESEIKGFFLIFFFLNMFSVLLVFSFISILYTVSFIGEQEMYGKVRGTLCSL